MAAKKLTELTNEQLAQLMAQEHEHALNAGDAINHALHLRRMKDARLEMIKRIRIKHLQALKV